MSGPNLVILTVVTSNIEADIISARLDAFGIPAFVFADNEGGMLPGISLSGGFRIMVPENTLEAAQEVLAST
tara:strand:+ start:805 stop:1020 length:216 start_codon:yes stop_codon:yes gene_type:complete